jgi:hypothetical protein
VRRLALALLHVPRDEIGRDRRRAVALEELPERREAIDDVLDLLPPARRPVERQQIRRQLLVPDASTRGGIGAPVATAPSRSFRKRLASSRFAARVLTRTGRPLT